MQALKTRLAERKDAKTVENLISEWSKQQWPTWQPERAETILEVLDERENHLILVSETPDEIVGVLHLVFYHDILLGFLNCHVNFLLVKEGYRGRGIGSGLLDEAKNEAKKRGALEMHVDTKFEDAAKFYRKYGFKEMVFGSKSGSARNSQTYKNFKPLRFFSVPA